MEVPSSSRGPSRKRKERDAAGPPEPSVAGNRLLAGYLAHEFLSSGTILGKPRGPATGAEAGHGQGYEAVAALVQNGGARVPGVVNPAQLAAWAEER